MAQNKEKIGQYHHLAKLSASDVDLIRELYAEGLWTYKQLAEKFDITKSMVGHIVKWRRRIRC